jgi:predicted Holliday junction resolvase-like endonuclease
MKTDMLGFFNVQRQIFGVCPNCNELFRLSDCRVYLRTRPTLDWMDRLALRNQKLLEATERLDQRESKLRDKARAKGRRQAMVAVRKIDAVFTPRRLNPDDAKVIFHPIDYVVFNGMKRGNSLKNLILLDAKDKKGEQRSVQRSIEACIEREKYEWRTLRVEQDGAIKAE